MDSTNHSVLASVVHGKFSRGTEHKSLLPPTHDQSLPRYGPFLSVDIALQSVLTSTALAVVCFELGYTRRQKTQRRLPSQYRFECMYLVRNLDGDVVWTETQVNREWTLIPLVTL